MSDYIRIQQIRSPIRRHYSQRRTLQSLGLDKIGRTVTVPFKGPMWGMIQKVRHLIRGDVRETAVTMCARYRVRSYPESALQAYIELEEERLRQEQAKEEERLWRQFLAGTYCGWTQIDQSENLYCRRNGRMFRMTRAKEKRWNLFRIATKEDIGCLDRGRGAANKALALIAYQFEPDW
jgi:ribosomal protein L30